MQAVSGRTARCSGRQAFNSSRNRHLRYIARGACAPVHNVSSRVRDSDRVPPHVEAVRNTPPSRIVAIVNALQLCCILSVIGIQLGVLISKIQTQRVADSNQQSFNRQTFKVQSTAQPAYHTVPASVVEFQPFLLAGALAGALFVNIFGPKRKVEVQLSNVVGQRVMQQQVDISTMRENLRLMDRKVGKVQARVMLCNEQLKALRTLTTDTRGLASETLTQHATSLADVQEQANSLQHVVSALQDVVVKQIEVMTPPIKTLNTRVGKLETSVSAIKQTCGESPSSNTAASKDSSAPPPGTPPGPHQTSTAATAGAPLRAFSSVSSQGASFERTACPQSFGCATDMVSQTLSNRTFVPTPVRWLAAAAKPPTLKSSQVSACHAPTSQGNSHASSTPTAAMWLGQGCSGVVSFRTENLDAADAGLCVRSSWILKAEEHTEQITSHDRRQQQSASIQSLPQLSVDYDSETGSGTVRVCRDMHFSGTVRLKRDSDYTGTVVVHRDLLPSPTIRLKRDTIVYGTVPLQRETKHAVAYASRAVDTVRSHVLSFCERVTAPSTLQFSGTGMQWDMTFSSIDALSSSSAAGTGLINWRRVFKLQGKQLASFVVRACVLTGITAACALVIS